MYCVPYLFFKKEEIKFPKNYSKKFKEFKNGNDILLAYGEVMIILQSWIKAYKNSNLKDDNTKKILKIKKKLITECFVTPKSSIFFHSTEMLDQFNYIYYLIATSLKRINK